MNDKKLPSYGGQALIEGVLMRGLKHVVAAMRAPDGHIEVVHEELSGIYKSRIRKWPVLRGLIMLWDSLGLGLRFLTISANTQTGEDEKITKPEMIGTLILSFGLAIALFFLAPAWLAQVLETKLHIAQWLGNLIEGVLRLAVVIVYMLFVSRMNEIKRVFRYHGAEHKTINAFENGFEITLDNVRAQSRLHARCGTAFMVTVVIISVVLFILIGPWTTTLSARLLSRLLLIPVIAGVAYEIIRWSAKHQNNPLVRALTWPNMAIQNITTGEPDDDMLECAMTAFNTMLEYETQTQAECSDFTDDEKAA